MLKRRSFRILGSREGDNASCWHGEPQSRLNAQQKRQLQAVLRKEASALGYPTDLWACARVAEVIEQKSLGSCRQRLSRESARGYLMLASAAVISGQK